MGQHPIQGDHMAQHFMVKETGISSSSVGTDALKVPL